MKIVSHTIVKNGMPFVGLVLEQVLPFVDKSLITVSSKSDDGTRAVLSKIKSRYRKKVYITTENVNDPAELTTERQKQIDETPQGAWVLFLDDDDYWPEKSLNEALQYLNENCDAFAFNPYQVVTFRHYDDSWRNKWFTKLFKNENITYRHPWPKDLIYKKDKVLYWRKNNRVIRKNIKFFHLSNIKNASFRNEEWAGKYKPEVGKMELFADDVREDLIKIYEYRQNK